MRNLISEINGNLPRTTKDISISLNGKNLIITGMNGCGKTVFLKLLFDAIVFSVDMPKKTQKSHIINQIHDLESRLQTGNVVYPDDTIVFLKMKLVGINRN